MFLSVFDLYKIGIGPSSSHTVGPMVAARRFLQSLTQRSGRIRVSLHGSLAFTGKGHGTDRAVVLGLAGETPQDIDPHAIEKILADMSTLRRSGPFDFDPAADVIFDFGPALKGHANGMVFRLEDAAGLVLASETYFSIGGGFVQTAAEREASLVNKQGTEQLAVPFPFRTRSDHAGHGPDIGLTIMAMKRANEEVAHGEALNAKLDHVWSVMDNCMRKRP